MTSPSLFSEPRDPSDHIATPRSSVVDHESSEEPTVNRGHSVTSIASATSRSKVSSEGRPFVFPGERKLFWQTYVRSHYFDAPEPIYTLWMVELYGYDYDAIQPGGDEVINHQRKREGGR